MSLKDLIPTLPSTTCAKRVSISLPHDPYEVLVGAGILSQVGEIAKSEAGGAVACIISDSHVAPLYVPTIEASLAQAGYEVAPTLVFPAGEQNKRFATLEVLLEGLAERRLARNDVIIAVGGGVTGDMAGLAAALYLRGCAVIQVPTSLLAMVDSSVGGKTAIDLAFGKNLVGAFWQPRAVVADVTCLSTIDTELLIDSCGEIVKHAVLADGSLLAKLIEHPVPELLNNPEALVALVARNIEIKRDVVVADERESSLRQTLNLGHTIGHAIESASDFSLGHGSCVAAGLAIVARIAKAQGWCSASDAHLIHEALRAHHLPLGTTCSLSDLLPYLSRDKKRSGSEVTLVVPHAIGHCELHPLSVEQLAHLIEPHLADPSTAPIRGGN